MRNSNRIPRIVAALERAWLRHPNWRLGQLVSNVIGPGVQDVFFPEDDKWEKALTELAEHNHA